MTPKRFCRVGIISSVPNLAREFDYSVPDRMVDHLSVGSIVGVKLGGKTHRGVCTALIDVPAVAKTRPVSRLYGPLFSDETMEAARAISVRYAVGIGSVIGGFLPGRITSVSNVANPADPPQFRVPSAATVRLEPTARPVPAAERVPVAQAATGAVPAATVISAGNTTRAMETAIAGPILDSDLKDWVLPALVLAPTGKLAKDLAQRFGASLYDASLRPAQRAEVWAQSQAGDIGVLVGTRAALLVPVLGLRTLVVAGAGDRSFKNERSPRVWAPWAARLRAAHSHATFTSVGPVPPLELWYHADNKVLRQIPRRPQVVNRPKKGALSPSALDTIRQTLDRKQDVLVLSARRGSSLRISCEVCEWHPTCLKCSVGLTPFERDGGPLLVCRVCGHTRQIPRRCSECGSLALASRGFGAQRIAQEISEALSCAAFAIDESTRPKKLPKPCVIVGHRAALNAAARPPGALIVSDADQFLSVPNIRAAERTLSLFEDALAACNQPCDVIVQTKRPAHHSIQSFVRGNYEHFATHELDFRERGGYPPFRELAIVTADASVASDLGVAIGELSQDVVGPYGVRDDLVRFLVKTPSLESISEGLTALAKLHASVRVDCDPYDVG